MRFVRFDPTHEHVCACRCLSTKLKRCCQKPKLIAKLFILKKNV